MGKGERKREKLHRNHNVSMETCLCPTGASCKSDWRENEALSPPKPERNCPGSKCVGGPNE